jgi:hypothetical protein
VQHVLPEVLTAPGWKSRTSHALKGCEKRGPTESRAPPPEEFVMAVLGSVLAEGQTFAATSLLLQFLSCARPGEIDGLTVGDVIPPLPHAGKTWGLPIAPTDGLNPAKTGERDESVLLENQGSRGSGRRC